MNASGACAHFDAKMAYTTGPVELQRAMDNGEVNVVDVRAASAYEVGHIPGSVSLPENLWDEAEHVLTTSRPNVFVCYSAVCHLAARAGARFSRAGYPSMELDGGMKEWTEYDMAVAAS
jgi:rhodanese-related sulfurtransferase